MLEQTAASFLLAGWMVQAALGAGPAYEEGKFPPPKPPEVKWIDLLAGKLNDHWTDMNCALAASFKLAVDDKGVAVLAGSGRPIGLVRSIRMYENFILEVEWRHLTEAPDAGHAGPGGSSGNSGIYVWADPIPALGNSFTRAIEVQVCNLGNGAWYTSHGDLFPIHGASMIADPRFGVSGSRSMPIEFRGSKTGQWNRCRVTCVDGTIQEEVNGAVVTAGYRCNPRKGYLCLESEGGPVEFRNMRLTELASNPDLKSEQVSIVLPQGVRTTSLFNGLNMEGWTSNEAKSSAWSFSGRILRCSGTSTGDLSHALPGGDFTLLVDWQTAKKGEKESAAPMRIDGLAMDGQIAADAIRPGWNRAEVRVKKNRATVLINGKVAASGAASAAIEVSSRTLRLLNRGHAIEFCNLMWMDDPGEH